LKKIGWTNRCTTRRLSRFALTLVLATSLMACEEGLLGYEEEGYQSNDRITITNTQGFLDARVSHPNADVPIESSSVPAGLAEPAAFQADALRLTLVSEIAPSIVDGELVQATSISRVKSDKVVVSYNMVGAPRLGAIDYITKLKRRAPRLTSEAIFNDSDVSAVSTDGHWVYAAEATDAPGFAYPAVFERLRIKGEKLSLESTSR